MNNDVYNRLKSLVSGVGISVADGNADDAELYCYAVALNAVREQIRSVMHEVFATNENGLKRYVKLLNVIPDGKSDEEIFAEIQSRLSDDYGNLDSGIMAQDFANVGSGQYTLSKGQITFSGVNSQDLNRLSEFINKWTTMVTLCVFDGNGTSFDQWDSLEKDFDYYDRLQLPFDILDTYNYNT